MDVNHFNPRTLLALSAFAFLTVGLEHVQAQQLVERLNRAPVAVTSTQGILLSWRSLPTDPTNLTFDIYRNDALVAKDIADVTNYLDPDGKAGNEYTVVSSAGERATVKAW